MIQHRNLFLIICFTLATLMTACAAPPKKTVSMGLRDITLSPAPAIIIKDHYTFVFETARCADTEQFLITTALVSIPALEKSLKVNFQGFSPKAAIPDSKDTKIKQWTVLFPVGESALNAGETQKLESFIKDYQKHSFGPVQVTGYTCRLGASEYNQKLALNRANTVGGILKKAGIQVRSITGKSKCCFISDTDPAQNRRVEITILPPVNQQPLKKDNRKEANKNE